MKSNTLLALLGDGSIHSGESLAASLGVSRTAIWKKVRRARARGCRIETLKGRGYQLLEPVDLLDADAIRRGLRRGLAEKVNLYVFDTTDSTNAEVTRRRTLAPVSATDHGEVTVCVADTQTAGRGRRGRVWRSPPGENLYMSLGLTVDGGFPALEGFSLVIGSAVADALERLGVPQVGLKWPNDILHDGRKLAGILIELQGEIEGSAQVIAGIGLNVNMREAPDVDQPWASLSQVVPETVWRRNNLTAELLNSILAATEEFATQGFRRFKQAWQQRDVFFDRDLTALQADLQGLGRGIDDGGNYRIETGNGIETVKAGEISLRIRA
jgi:BirA family biotin operon repressor/biotin-[acetyl-CoA-carboxylase] ligase